MNITACGKTSGILASIALLALPASAQITGSLGTSSVSYGGPLAVQSINTGFGSAAGGSADDSTGSELDAAYGTVSGGNLYLFLAGDFQNNGNQLNIFINDGQAGGQGTLNISSGWTASAMNGSTFSPGFSANVMLDANDYGGTVYVDQYVLSSGGSANSYLGSVTLNNGVGSGTLGQIGVALNNTHTSTMGSPGGAYTPTAGDKTGMELAIPLSTLGNPSGPIEVLADINGNGDNYLSNQFLSGLPGGTQNLGNGGIFNFSSTAGEYFTVPVPEPTTLALLGMSGLGALFAFRRRK